MFDLFPNPNSNIKHPRVDLCFCNFTHSNPSSLSKLCFNPKSLEKYPFEPSLNGTLVAVIGIYNKNFGYFKYEKSSIAFLYQNVTLGVVNVTGGLVFVRRTERVNAMVEVRSNYLLNKNQNFTRDVDSDLLELRSLATLVGRVHVAGIFKLRTRKLMNCSMTLNLPSKAIQDLTCL